MWRATDVLEFYWSARIGGHTRNATSHATFGAVCDWAAQRTGRAAAEDASGSEDDYHECGSISDTSDSSCCGHAPRESTSGTRRKQQRCGPATSRSGSAGSESDGVTHATQQAVCGTCAANEGPPIPTPDTFIGLRKKLRCYGARARAAAIAAAGNAATKLGLHRQNIVCEFLGQNMNDSVYEPDPLLWEPCGTDVVRVMLAFEWTVRLVNGNRCTIVQERLDALLAAGSVPMPHNWEFAMHCDHLLAEAAHNSEKKARQYCPAHSATECTILGKPTPSVPLACAPHCGGAHPANDASIGARRMLAAHITSNQWLACTTAQAWDDADNGHIDASSYTKIVVRECGDADAAKRRRITRTARCDLRELASARPSATSALLAAAQWHAELERALPRINIKHGTRCFEPSPWHWEGSNEGRCGRIWVLWAVYRYARDRREVNQPSITKFFLSSAVLHDVLNRKSIPIPQGLKDTPLDRQQPVRVPTPIYYGKRTWYMSFPAKDADVPRRGACTRGRNARTPLANGPQSNTPIAFGEAQRMPRNSTQPHAAIAPTETDSESGSEGVAGDIAGDVVHTDECDASDHGYCGVEEISGCDYHLDAAQQSTEDEIHMAYCRATEMGDAGVRNRRAMQAAMNGGRAHPPMQSGTPADEVLACEPIKTRKAKFVAHKIAIPKIKRAPMGLL